MRFKCLLFIAALVFLPIAVWADTQNAASCSLSDVTAAYNAASAGDIVVIPAGSATWSNTLTISKAITLKGAGINYTQITGSGTTKLVEINLSSDVFVRITGIYFKYLSNNLGTDAPAVHVVGKQDGSFAYTQIRIDNCKFEKSKRIVKVSGWVYGVIDNNQFLNNDIAIGIDGDNNYSWDRPIAAGTVNNLFIEDNIFYIDNDTDRQPNHLIYHFKGARTVTRYNTFDGSSYTAGGVCLFYDSHGNLNYYIGTYLDLIGQPIVEVYNNTFHAYRGQAGSFQFRSGSALVYNNDFTLESGSQWYIPYLYEEEQWNNNMFNPLRTEWPAEDNIVNTFFWNNTGNWSGDTSDGTNITGVYVLASAEPFIQENRDYFMHAPQSSGGKSIYTGRAGASNAYPTDGGSDTTEFVSAVANAYYPYTAYTYPHPLRTGDGIVTMPKNLRIK